MTKTKEIIEEVIEKVMKGDTDNESYNVLKNMFPELFNQITKDMRQALTLLADKMQEENTEKCREIYSKEWDKIRDEERECVFKEFSLALKEFEKEIDKMIKNYKAVQVDIGEYDKFISVHKLKHLLHSGKFGEIMEGKNEQI